MVSVDHQIADTFRSVGRLGFSGGIISLSSRPQTTPLPLSQSAYCTYPRRLTDLSEWEKLTLVGGNDLARALSWLVRKFSHLSLERTALDGDVGHIRDHINFYRKLRGADPQSFFPVPSAVPSIELTTPHPLTVGEVFDISFESGYVPTFEPFREEFARYTENRTVHARMWRHPKGKSLGRVIAIHGWFMGDQRLNALALAPGFFFRLGLDVILYELPYHGRRAPGEHGTSQMLFPSSHLVRTNEAMAQAIYDLRSLALWLASEDDLPIGVVGVSLGGYTAALWASLDLLSFAIPIVPLVSMGEMAWRMLQATCSEYADLPFCALLTSVTEKEIDEAYAIHCPLSYQPKVRTDRRMIIAGLGDSIVPSNQPYSLWEHWEKPCIHWFDGQHLEQMSQREAFNVVHEFLTSHQLAHRELLDIRNL